MLYLYPKQIGGYVVRSKTSPIFRSYILFLASLVSFRVLELIVGSDDRERLGLAKRRMLRSSKVKYCT